jgi:hypothetical protein
VLSTTISDLPVRRIQCEPNADSARLRAGSAADVRARRSSASVHSFRSVRDLGRIRPGVHARPKPGHAVCPDGPQLGSRRDDQEGDHAGSRPSSPSVRSSVGKSVATGTAGPKARPRAAWSWSGPKAWWTRLYRGASVPGSASNGKPVPRARSHSWTTSSPSRMIPVTSPGWSAPPTRVIPVQACGSCQASASARTWRAARCASQGRASTRHPRAPCPPTRRAT